MNNNLIGFLEKSKDLVLISQRYLAAKAFSGGKLGGGISSKYNKKNN